MQASTKLNIENIFTFVSNQSEILGESESENLKIIGFLLSFLCHFDFIHPTQWRAKCIYLLFSSSFKKEKFSEKYTVDGFQF